MSEQGTLPQSFSFPTGCDTVTSCHRTNCHDNGIEACRFCDISVRYCEEHTYLCEACQQFVCDRHSEAVAVGREILFFCMGRCSFAVKDDVEADLIAEEERVLVTA